MSATEHDATTPRPRRKSTQGRYRPPTWRSLVLLLAFAAVLGVYLFVTAPPPLAAAVTPAGKIPIRTVFALLDRENAAARALWAEEIVGRGTAVGLQFDEHWRDAKVQAGPLPALFLRETARNLERTSLRLGLFLGSPFPINPANKFTGEQQAHFDALLEHAGPQHFVDPSTGMQTAMFRDLAVSETCVSCHDEHDGSPKTDWRLGEVMGATTWMYPDASVSADRALDLVGALRTSIRQAYAAYLQKVATFPTRPQIGAKWPRDGFALPSEDVFMRELARRSSSAMMLALIDPDAADATLDEPVAVVAPTAAPVAPAAARDGTLVLRSTRSTRVIVEHAGNRLLVARLQPGTVTTLTSPPPLRVQLTDSEGIDVQYGGKKIAVPPVGAVERAKGVEVVVAAPNPEKS